MWLDAPESTNHTSSDFEVLVRLDAIIEFDLCLITNIPPRSSYWGREHGAGPACGEVAASSGLWWRAWS